VLRVKCFGDVPHEHTGPGFIDGKTVAYSDDLREEQVCVEKFIGDDIRHCNSDGAQVVVPDLELVEGLVRVGCMQQLSYWRFASLFCSWVLVDLAGSNNWLTIACSSRSSNLSFTALYGVCLSSAF
jgi:hypothetical protein